MEQRATSVGVRVCRGGVEFECACGWQLLMEEDHANDKLLKLLEQACVRVACEGPNTTQCKL